MIHIFLKTLAWTLTSITSGIGIAELLFQFIITDISVQVGKFAAGDVSGRVCV